MPLLVLIVFPILMVASQSLPNEQRVISSCSFGIKHVAYICSNLPYFSYLPQSLNGGNNVFNNLTNLSSLKLKQTPVVPYFETYSTLINMFMSILLHSLSNSSFLFPFYSYHLVFNLLICVLFMHRVKTLALALLIVKNITSVHSQSLPSFIYHKATPAPDIKASSSLENFFKSELSWIHAILVICFIIIFIQLIVIYFLYKSKPSKNTKVILELTSGGECVIIPLITLPLCPSYYLIQKPIIHRLSASNFTSRQLKADWSPFEIIDKLSNKSITVPSQIPVNYLIYRKLLKILKQPFCAYVMVTHQGFSTVIQDQVDSGDMLDLC